MNPVFQAASAAALDAALRDVSGVQTVHTAAAADAPAGTFPCLCGLSFTSFHVLLRCLPSRASQGHSVHAKDKYGRTALHVHALRGRADVVQALIEAGADALEPDVLLNTPLHVARTAAVTHALLAPHVQALDAANRKGQLPLHTAAAHARLDVMNVLLLAGADCNAKDSNGARCLLFVALRCTLAHSSRPSFSPYFLPRPHAVVVRGGTRRRRRCPGAAGRWCRRRRRGRLGMDVFALCGARHVAAGASAAACCWFCFSRMWQFKVCVYVGVRVCVHA